MSLALACAVLGACRGERGGAAGGDESALAAVGGYDPCRLLDKVEVEQALGAPVGEGTDPARAGGLPAIGVVGMRFCAFRAVDPPGPSLQVGVTSAYARQVFDKYKSAPSNQPLVPVAHVGQEAVWFERNKTLVVLDRATVVGVYLRAPGGGLADQAVAIDLARAMLERVAVPG